MVSHSTKSKDNQQIRSFVAIQLPKDLKSGLLRLQTELKSTKCSFVKWVLPESIHLTLKFLGNIAFQKVGEITKAISRASEETLPFELETADLGVFPTLKNPRVFWLGVAGDLNTLLALQKRIDDVMGPMGFAREKRIFTPHLTLARIRENASPQNRREFSYLISKAHFDIRYKIEVNSISLIKSQLLSSGAVYSNLAEINLGNQS